MQARPCGCGATRLTSACTGISTSRQALDKLATEWSSENLTKKESYNYQDLIEMANGNMFGPGNAKLPLPNMLMLDRITRISDEGGTYGNGEIIAELDINPKLWFFECHFKDDPVMPGCLGLDAMWQLLGVFLGWSGNPGRGRALGVGEVKFSGQVNNTVEKVTYIIDIKRVFNMKLTLGIADGRMLADGEEIYSAKNLRVGLITSND